MNQSEINGNTIKIPALLKYLPEVDEFVEGKLKEWEADGSTIADIAISVSELITNSITHGSKVNPEAPVILKIELIKNSVEINIFDKGQGFDPDEIDDPLAEENLLKDTGRGIFIVKTLMDEVNVETTSDGTKIQIKKAI